MAASEHVTLTRMKAAGNTAGVSSPGSEWVLLGAREEKTKHACAIWDVLPDGTRVKKEVPTPFKARALKALKAKEAVLKGVHSQRKGDVHVTHLLAVQDTALPRQPEYPWKSSPRRNRLDHYATVKFPLITKSAMKKTEDNDTLIGDVKASKYQVKQAVKKKLMTWPKSASSSAQWKEVCVQPAPDYDVLDVANKIRII
uniref:60S ribosomal protein L23a-like n=1 Tax=Ictidomys tridecemlineatus TaxID=43179 RepID=UPI00038BFF91|nr:60S ribosomal protein L23a-like [Ictidomys tridecemlineatus]